MKTTLTESNAEALAPGQIIRDDRIAGLMAIGRKGPTSFAVQSDIRRNGQFFRTCRYTIGKQGEISIKDARVVAMEAKSLMHKGVDPNNKHAKSIAELTILSCVQDHINERDLAERTKHEYLQHFTDKKLNTLVSYANVHPKAITRDDVRKTKARLMKRGTALAAGALRVLRLTLTHAMRLDETIKENPVHFVVVPPVKKRDVDPVDLSVFACRANDLSPMHKALWTLSLLTGARRSSILTMKRSDVDTERGILHLSHVKTMKDGASLPIGKRLAKLLEDYLEQPSASEWLWPGRGDGPLKDMRFRRRDWPYGSHQLRHNWTTLATRADVPMMEQRLLMLHALPGMGQTYTHGEHLIEHLRQYAEAVEDLVAHDAPELFS